MDGGCMNPHWSRDCQPRPAESHPGLKGTRLRPTWGIEAVGIILGGVGREDVHPRVVRSTDGIGVDPWNHHMPVYEPVPAKENQRSSTCNSVIRDFIKSHPTTFHAVQYFLQLTPRHVRVFNNWVTQKPKTTAEGQWKGPIRLMEMKWFSWSSIKLFKTIDPCQWNLWSAVSLNEQREAKIMDKMIPLPCEIHSGLPLPSYLPENTENDWLPSDGN